MDTEVFPLFVGQLDPSIMERVEKLAEKLSQLRVVHGVWLFGSRARQEAGYDSDVDLIIGVDERIFRYFLDDLSPAIQSGLRGLREDLYRAKKERLFAAENIFRHDWSRESSGPIFDGLGYRLDLFLFPSNWLDRLEELQQALPNRDPEFMWKVAKDAVEFNSQSGQFIL